MDITIGRRRGTAAAPRINYAAESTLLVSDGKYNSFPGVVTCPNGDILAAYRSGTSHTAGGNLYTLRSTDDGATWGDPVLVAASTGTHAWGTATLSVIDGNRIAIVSWVRHPAGGSPGANATRILISDDNGETWDTPLTVTLDATWDGKFSVSESALVYRGGWYYLGVWGRSLAGGVYYTAGVARSADLTTWATVAYFDNGSEAQFNEIGVAAIGSRLVCVIRNESAGRWSSTSYDGLTWTAPTRVWTGFGEGAPKLAQDPMLGYNIFPVRLGATGGVMACVNAAGDYSHLGNFMEGTAFMYGQTCKISPTTGGVLYAAGPVEGGLCDLFWRPFEVVPISGWEGATIATFGDSITWYDGQVFNSSHVQSGQAAIGYQSHIRADLGATVTNLGVSGYAMREICDLIQATSLSGVDVVTITSGANDFKDGEPIGTIATPGSTFNEGTFIGALQAAIEHISNTYPTTRIFLLTPIQGWSGATLMPTTWPQAIADVGGLYGLPVCDWYNESGITEATRATYIGDIDSMPYDLHPTNAGFAVMGEIVVSFLRQQGPPAA